MVWREAKDIFLSQGQLGQLGQLRKGLIGNDMIVRPFGQICSTLFLWSGESQTKFFLAQGQFGQLGKASIGDDMIVRLFWSN